LRSGTHSAHGESSIDATCIHDLIVKEEWMDIRLKRDLHEGSLVNAYRFAESCRRYPVSTATQEVDD
jgi:hypothetical protein